MNRVLRNVISIVAVLVIASSIAAAQQAELNGTWALEAKNAQKQPETTVVISESGPQIKITETQRQNGQTVTRELIYFADGRGETNAGSNSKIQLHSTSRRSGRKLIVKFSLPQTRVNNLLVTNDRVDEWTISKDGKTLKYTRSMHASSQPGDVSSNPSNGAFLPGALNWEERRVFKRVP